MLLMFVSTLPFNAFPFQFIVWRVRVHNSVSGLSVIFARFAGDEYRLRGGSGRNNCRLNLHWLPSGARF